MLFEVITTCLLSFTVSDVYECYRYVGEMRKSNITKINTGASELENMLANPVKAYKLVSDMTLDTEQILQLMVSTSDDGNHCYL